MAQRSNHTKSQKLQVTVDQNTFRVIEDMGQIGLNGSNRSEVAAWILTNWLWNNQAQLSSNGINLVRTNTKSDRGGE